MEVWVVGRCSHSPNDFEDVKNKPNVEAMSNTEGASDHNRRLGDARRCVERDGAEHRYLQWAKARNRSHISLLGHSQRFWAWQKTTRHATRCDDLGNLIKRLHIKACRINLLDVQLTPQSLHQCLPFTVIRALYYAQQKIKSVMLFARE